MRVGLGTGSTARWFIEALGERIAAGLRVHGVATSFVTQRLAEDHGITMHPLTRAGLDLAVDGADQVDPQLRVVKGAGGALVREKIVAAAAERFVVIVDDSKVVPRLSGAVPVELLTFGIEHTLALLDATGGRFATRITPDGELERSENGNLLADGMYGDIDDPEDLAVRLETTPGVVDHGLFLGMASLVLVGREDDSVEELRPAAT